MKNKRTLLIFTMMMTSMTLMAQNDKALIEQAVLQFSKAGDERNTESLTHLLHDDFRIVMNRLFGSETVTLMTKDVYIKMIQDGKLGGDQRTVKIISIDITENNASVKVSLKGTELTFQSYYQLVKNVSGQWQLINDLPFATKN